MEDGYRLYGYIRPSSGVLCEFKGESWNNSVVCYSHELNPEMNIIGLWWRLTGIGKKQIEGRSPEQINQEMQVSSLQYSNALCNGGIWGGMLNGIY